jgi:hypothetical protein
MPPDTGNVIILAGLVSYIDFLILSTKLLGCLCNYWLVDSSKVICFGSETWLGCGCTVLFGSCPCDGLGFLIVVELILFDPSLNLPYGFVCTPLVLSHLG